LGPLAVDTIMSAMYSLDRASSLRAALVVVKLAGLAGGEGTDGEPT